MEVNIIYPAELSKLIQSGEDIQIVDLREEVKKGVNKERYLSKEDAKLLNKFFKKIQRELNESEN